MKVAVGGDNGLETSEQVGCRSSRYREITAMSARHFLLFFFGALIAAVPSSAGILEGNCRLADQPAATMLIPYFEVDLADPAGQTTLFSVNNASAKSTLARVVLWTNWGVPSLAFDVYLTGYDVQTINLRDLFAGTLPQTGPDTSNSGSLSETGTL